MVQRYSQNITTSTVQGEITVNLNLTITLNGDGSVSVVPDKGTTVKELPADSRYVIPEFDSGELLSDFGAGR